jgi:hypothetical protein
MVSGFRSATGRRTLIAIGVAASLCAASTLKAHPAQDPAAPAAAAPAQTAPDPLKLNTEFALIINQIKSEKAADFESAWTTIKGKLSSSAKPELKELGDGLKIYKVDTPPVAGQPVVYIFHLQPPSKTQSYDPTKILYYSGAFPDRPEADALYAKIKDAYQGIFPWPLKQIGG